MAIPNLQPDSSTPTNILLYSGSFASAEEESNYPFGVYVDPSSELYDPNFISGAVDQVKYTYRKLGGDILDIELDEKSVYAAYEEAVLEYSYIVNLHQAVNTLPNALGNTTGTFDHDGRIKEFDQNGHALSGSHISLKYPRFNFAYARRVADFTSHESEVGGTQDIYSASFGLTPLVQDYNLQSIIVDNATGKSYENLVSENTRIIIRRVYYKTPHAMWRFYGYYGGFNTIGNLSTYGQYADDSTFEVIPPWQNKLQAMAYEDAIWTRNSHYSYRIRNNKLKIFPIPTSGSPTQMWFDFSILHDAFEDDPSLHDSGLHGINNVNTLPFGNLPYENINSIGKQWIRRFALSLTKEILGLVRSKFSSLPIPGNEVTLNGTELISHAREEQDKLREELKEILSTLTYKEVLKMNAEMTKDANDTLKTIPLSIFVG